MNRWHATWMTLLWTLCGLAAAGEAETELDARRGKLLAELRACRFKIIYETYRGKNWELMIVNADGSDPVNITRTPGVDEMYPHASPDGTKVVFVADQRRGRRRTHEVYCMNIDGTGRIKVGRNGRQPFWSPDGKVIGYVRGIRGNYTEAPRGNRRLYFYNIETRRETRHPRRDIFGVLNPCWSSNGRWIVCTILGGMGFADSIVAFEADGKRVFELARTHSEARNVYQCRPDISPDDRHVAWGKDDVDNHFGFGRRAMFVEVADVDFDSPAPKVTARRYVITVKYPLETYHVDWSPDSRYIAYSRGERGTGRMAGSRTVIGHKAPGWDIWVVKPSEPEVTVQLTHDGLSNKEPDWVVVGQEEGASDK